MSLLFSKQCEYALQAVAFLALKPRGEMTSIKELTERFKIPYHILAKILQRLARKGLLVSLKGPKGGFALAMSPKEITLFHVVEAVDGLAIMNACVLGFSECGGSHPCAVHDKWEAVRGQIYTMLSFSNFGSTRHQDAKVVEEAVKICRNASSTRGGNRRGIIRVREMRKPRAAVVITGNEVYQGKIRDAFATIISDKIGAFGGELVGTYYAPDDEAFIESRLRELVDAGADLLVTTGGMSVDPDDVTRFAIRNLGATDITYGSAVLPGAMFLVAYLTPPHPPLARGGDGGVIPILGIPACGMYAKTTVFDLVLPRVLAGEKMGRRELAESSPLRPNASTTRSRSTRASRGSGWSDRPF